MEAAIHESNAATTDNGDRPASPTKQRMFGEVEFRGKHARRARKIVRGVLGDAEIRRAITAMNLQNATAARVRSAYDARVQEAEGATGERRDDLEAEADNLARAAREAEMAASGAQTQVFMSLADAVLDEDKVSGLLDELLADLVGRPLEELDEEGADWWPEAIRALTASEGFRDFLGSFSALLREAGPAISTLSSPATDGGTPT